MKRLLVFIFLALYNTILFAQILPSPGGVGQSNLTAWFKATDLANGNVTSWTTAYPTGGSAITVTEAGAPYPVATNTPTGNTSNYNTTIYFDTTNLTNNYATNLRGLLNTSSLDLLDNKGFGDEGTFFGSYHYPNHYDNNDHMMDFNEGSGGVDFDAVQFRQLTNAGRLAIGHLGAVSSNAGRTWSRTFYPEIVSYRGNRASSTSMESYKDSKKYTASSVTQCSGNQGLVFGYKQGSATSQYKGFLNEFIFFNRDLTDSEMLRVDSYLAVKYGITLDNTGGGTQGDYYGSDGFMVWDASDNPSYHNHVVGISMDSASGLYQLQSHTFDDTTRIYRGIAIALTNDANINYFGDEISYIMMGHNEGNMYADINSNTEMPAMCGANPFTSRLGREWKVTRTDAAQPFGLDLTLNTNANLANVNPSHLRILVDDDGDFSNGGTICYAHGDSALSITYNGPIISITNIKKQLIPNDETRYITLASIDLATPLAFVLEIDNPLPISACDSVVLPIITGNQLTGGQAYYSSSGGNGTSFISGTIYTDTILYLYDQTGGVPNVFDEDTLFITVNNAVTGIDVQTTCNSYTWIDGNTYTTSNTTAIDTIFGGSFNGCDSLVTLNLTINNAVTGLDVQTACNSYTWIDGNTYTTSNTTAIDTIFGGSLNGCDSIVTLSLTINNLATGIDVQAACSSFTWMDGNTYISNNNTATYTMPGVAVNGCDSVVTLSLTVLPEVTVDLGEDVGYCEEAILLNPGLGYSSYLWDDGTSLESLLVNVEGIYSVVVTDANGCKASDEIEIYYDCPITLFVPNVFTPNGDGLNDVFAAYGQYIEEYELLIFNRWGNLLFETNNILDSWDGKHKGTDSPSGTYFYTISYYDEAKMSIIKKNGIINLLK